MQAGAAIVPVFALGQTPHYSFWRPFIDSPRGLVPSGAMARRGRGAWRARAGEGEALGSGTRGGARCAAALVAATAEQGVLVPSLPTPPDCPADPTGRSFVRRIGFVPMLVWGAHGTALPHRVRARAGSCIPRAAWDLTSAARAPGAALKPARCIC